MKIPDLSTSERPLPQVGGGLASYRADFGGAEQAGQAMMQAGKQIEHGGDEIFARAKVEQEKLDTLKAEDAFTKLREKQLELTIGDGTGYARLKGKEALNTPVLDDWKGKFGEAVKGIEFGLTTEEQKIKFRQRANVANIQFQEGILHHVIKESDSYAKEVFDGTVATETRQAAANWQDANNPQGPVALSLARIGEAVISQSLRNAWPSQYEESVRLKAQGAVHSAVIDQAVASKQFQFAEEYYKKNKADVDPQTAKRLESAVYNGTQRQLSGEYALNIVAAKDSPDILGSMRDQILTDRVLEDAPKRTLLNDIDARIKRAETQQTTANSLVEKEIEKQISKVRSVSLASFEPPAEMMLPLINATKGTRFEAEVSELVKTIDLTKEFRRMPPAQQAAKITEMTVNYRDSGTTNVFERLLKAIPGIETGGLKDPSNATSVQGAKGRWQVMEGTFDQYKKPGEVYSNEKDREATAIRKLSDDFAFYNGDPLKTAAAYIGGRGAVLPDGTIRDDVKDKLGTTPKEYARRVGQLLGGGAMQFDVSLIKHFEAIHEAQKTALKESPVSYAVKQELVSKEDPGAQPIDMSNPAGIPYAGMQRRITIAQNMETKYGAAFKPLTPEETNLAVVTIKNLDIAGKKKYFADLYQAASNNAGTIVSGMRDDIGGARAYKAIMAQIAPDSPVLAHAGMSAARGQADPKEGAVADLILRGYHILNPDQKGDGKPDSGKLRPMPPEAKMRLDFDNTVRDAYAGNDDARNGYYQTAKAIYAALSSKSADADTTKLDSTRWAESIKMATGTITSWNGKYTPIPWGMERGQFKDRLAENITGLVSSGRLNPSMTRQKLNDMKLEPIRDGQYVFREGDTVLADRMGKPVVVDLSRAAPWTPPEAMQPRTGEPTQAELEIAGKPYFGRNSNNFGSRTDGSPKGNGWLGVLKRPDGGVSTELSAQYDDVIGGRPFPLLVPTLTKDEVKTLLALKDNERAPKAIVNKAIAHAEQRVRDGKSPFKE